MNRRQFATLLVVLFTVGLAGVAVFTAVRLYQQRTQSVAPTAPTSIPRAAEPLAEAAKAGRTSCSEVVFNIGTETPPASCNESCTNNSQCETGLECINGSCRNPSCSTETDCTCTTTTPICGDTCSPGVAGQCPNDHTCSTDTNTCVLNECLESGVTCNTNRCEVVEDTPPVSCNNTCSTTQPCATGLSCVNGSCRNPNCTNETDCTCPTGSAPTPTPVAQATPAPSLPQAGVATPTLIGGILGILAIIGALALAL